MYKDRYLAIFQVANLQYPAKTRPLNFHRSHPPQVPLVFS
jgi:hypothetical protein